jgi:hypothetical protein
MEEAEAAEVRMMAPVEPWAPVGNREEKGFWSSNSCHTKDWKHRRTGSQRDGRPCTVGEEIVGSCLGGEPATSPHRATALKIFCKKHPGAPCRDGSLNTVVHAPRLLALTPCTGGKSANPVRLRRVRDTHACTLTHLT